MKDVMHDIETRGDSAGCVLLSIGAVTFDPETGEMGDEFYSVISTASCIVAGLRFDQGTLDWWDKQSPEAREVLKQAASRDAPPLRAVLHDFSRYLNKACGGKDALLWGNGADFDNPILRDAYRVTGIDYPIRPWNGRCYRTLKNEWSEVPLPKRIGVFHNALDDAKTQAVHALQIFGHRKKRLQPVPGVAMPGAEVLRPLAGALANLRLHQRQLDADGCTVGVSRQALDQVLGALGVPDLIPAESPALEEDLIG